MYWNALILGFLGSTHCILMCGPLVMAIPGQKTFSRFFFSRIIYNVGRIITYSIMGLFFGLLGRFLSLASFQQAFSITLGVFICLMAFTLIAQKIEGKLSKLIYKVIQPLKKWIFSYFKKTGVTATFIAGVLNGLLPCGLVYVALAASLGTFSLQAGSLFMIVFGLGTLPAMLIMAMIGNLSLSKRINKISSFYMFFMGLILIIRGSNLDIPYLSPVLGFLYPGMADPVICN